MNTLLASASILIIFMLNSLPALAFELHKSSIPDGWVSAAKLGASATTGSSETSSISASLKTSYKYKRWENLVSAKALKTRSSIVIERVDASGTIVVDENGAAILDLIKATTNDRRFIDYQLKWYWKDPIFLFAKIDWETNNPARIESSTRQIFGVGYTLKKDKYNLLTVEIGAGSKRLSQTGTPKTRDNIGYLGIEYAHRITERTRFSVELTSDFGSDNQFSELELNFGIDLSERVSLAAGYTTRLNDGTEDTRNPLSSNVDSETAINLIFDII